MKKLLNTLYVTTPESYIARDGLNILVLIDNEERFRIPIHNIEGIVSLTFSGMSPAAMQLCMENNVGVSFLTPSGRFLGRVSGAIKGNILLRREQYTLAEDPIRSLNIARIIIFGKITNYRNVLMRYIRDYGANSQIEETSRALDIRRKEALECANFDRLRGIEGDAAKRYFDIFNILLLNSDRLMHIVGRTKRPPKDRTNALLSFCYTLLTHDVQNALETVGLDAYCGVFHTLRPGRASLALDIIEEFRAYMTDRFVISLINKKQITAKDFINHADQSFMLTENARKELISAWQKRKKEIITHPFLNEKVEIGLLPHIQALLLARYIRGDMDNYPVFISK